MAAAGGAAVPAGLLAVVPVPLFGVEVPLFEQAVTDSATITATGKARSTHILLMMRTARGYIPPLSAYVGDSGWSNVAALARDSAGRQFRPAIRECATEERGGVDAILDLLFAADKARRGAR